MMQEVFVGVDVAKDWLDIHHPRHGARRIGNTPSALQAFVAVCAKEGAWVVFEASGGGRVSKVVEILRRGFRAG